MGKARAIAQVVPHCQPREDGVSLEDDRAVRPWTFNRSAADQRATLGGLRETRNEI